MFNKAAKLLDKADSWMSKVITSAGPMLEQFDEAEVRPDDLLLEEG